jgi:hypothetical protein
MSADNEFKEVFHGRYNCINSVKRYHHVCDVIRDYEIDEDIDTINSLRKLEQLRLKLFDLIQKADLCYRMRKRHKLECVLESQWDEAHEHEIQNALDKKYYLIYLLEQIHSRQIEIISKNPNSSDEDVYNLEYDLNVEDKQIENLDTSISTIEDEEKLFEELFGNTYNERIIYDNFLQSINEHLYSTNITNDIIYMLCSNYIKIIVEKGFNRRLLRTKYFTELEFAHAMLKYYIISFLAQKETNIFIDLSNIDEIMSVLLDDDILLNSQISDIEYANNIWKEIIYIIKNNMTYYHVHIIIKKKKNILIDNFFFFLISKELLECMDVQYLALDMITAPNNELNEEHRFIRLSADFSCEQIQHRINNLPSTLTKSELITSDGQILKDRDIIGDSITTTNFTIKISTKANNPNFLIWKNNSVSVNIRI